MVGRGEMEWMQYRGLVAVQGLGEQVAVDTIQCVRTAYTLGESFYRLL